MELDCRTLTKLREPNFIGINMNKFKTGIIVSIFLINLNAHSAQKQTKPNSLKLSAEFILWQARLDTQKLNREFESSYRLHKAIEQDDAQEVSNALQAFPALVNNDFLGRIKPLSYAVMLRSNQAFDTILAAGADLENTDPISGDCLLHTAAHFANLHATRKLIERGLSVTAQNKNGQIPLHNALQAENTEIETQEKLNLIDCLLSKAPHTINKQDKFGATVLHYAVIRNILPLICQCTENDIDTLIQDKQGWTAFDYAIFYKNVAAFEKVYDALRYNYCDKNLLIKLLQGACPQFDYNSDSKKLALRSNHDLAQRLHYDQDKLNKILIRAHKLGHLEIIILALQCGANINILNIHDFLYRAPAFVPYPPGNIIIAQGLIAAGADIHSTSRDMLDTPLHIACNRGHMATVQALIDAKAKVNSTNAYRNTPLHEASSRGHTATVQALIDAGADVTLKNEQNETALDIANRASGNKKSAVVQLLENEAAKKLAKCNVAEKELSEKKGIEHCCVLQ